MAQQDQSTQEYGRVAHRHWSPRAWISVVLRFQLPDSGAGKVILLENWARVQLV
jgi:hypothetical protein